MMRNSREVYYLADSEKVDKPGGRVVLGDFSLVDGVISNYRFSDETKSRFPDVRFTETEA